MSEHVPGNPSGDRVNREDVVRYKRTVLATCCVPWSAPFEFDEVIFRRSVRGLLSRGMKDLYIFGTAGEGHAVNDALFATIVDAFLDEMALEGATPMVGVISSSVATMQDRVRYCLERGCVNFQFAISGWGGGGAKELRSVFHQLCGKFPTASFLHYNTARSGRIVFRGSIGSSRTSSPTLLASNTERETLKC